MRRGRARRRLVPNGCPPLRSPRAHALVEGDVRRLAKPCCAPTESPSTRCAIGSLSHPRRGQIEIRFYLYTLIGGGDSPSSLPSLFPGTLVGSPLHLSAESLSATCSFVTWFPGESHSRPSPAKPSAAPLALPSACAGHSLPLSLSMLPSACALISCVQSPARSYPPSQDARLLSLEWPSYRGRVISSSSNASLFPQFGEKGRDHLPLPVVAFWCVFSLLAVARGAQRPVLLPHDEPFRFAH